MWEWKSWRKGKENVHIYHILMFLFLCCSMQVIATLDEYQNEKENTSWNPGWKDAKQISHIIFVLWVASLWGLPPCFPHAQHCPLCQICQSVDHPTWLVASLTSHIAWVELTHGTPLPVREHWEEVVQEWAVVGSVPLDPECEEADDPLSPTTRLLLHLEEDLLSLHINYTVDSDRDHLHPHSLSQTITHALRLGNLQPSFTSISQVSALPEERDLNDDIPTPDLPAPALLPSQWLLHGPSLDWWLEQDLHPEPVVLRPFNGMQHTLGRYKRQREEPEQEEAPCKKRICKQYKRKIHWWEDDNYAPVISKQWLRPQASLQKLHRYL